MAMVADTPIVSMVTFGTHEGGGTFIDFLYFMEVFYEDILLFAIIYSLVSYKIIHCCLY